MEGIVNFVWDFASKCQHVRQVQPNEGESRQRDRKGFVSST